MVPVLHFKTIQYLKKGELRLPFFVARHLSSLALTLMDSHGLQIPIQESPISQTTPRS